MAFAGNPSIVSHGAADVLRRWGSRLAVSALLVFHVALLWSHLASGQLFEPTTALRWVIGVGLFCSFVLLRRAGVPVLWGRRAVGLWLLVILLHCHAALSPSALPDQPSTWSQMLATLVTEGSTGTTVAAAGLLLLSMLRRRLQPPPRQRTCRATADRRVHLPSSPLVSLVSFPRPPPVFAS